MTLFMLNHHDRSREAIRDLAPAELDAIFGGDGSFATIGDDPGGCDQTTCETMRVTPNGDGGDISTDCDAG
ncbi:hypothetical protein ACWCOP_14200 [Maricaulaceae bacterium MS644]